MSLDASENVRQAADLLVSELGIATAESELQRRFRDSDGEYQNRVKTALTHVRKIDGESK